ncbi:MAG: hypothetical protein IT229_06540 [Flavobacteriales bacterium]|nr:hypothetical protein [Flavobacteriales bacterium]
MEPDENLPELQTERNPKWFWLCFLVFTALNIFLALNKHSHGGRNTYHDELWADRAGYFIYLPATFQIGFDATLYPQQLDSLTGLGFRMVGSQVRTKYTCGVAIAQAPIYVGVHLFNKFMKVPSEPFGDLDRLVVDVAAPIALSLGMFFLFSLLSSAYGVAFTLRSLIGLYTTTGLFYYTVGDPGMSHVYSFMLFSLLLLLLKRTSGGRHSRWRLIGIGLTVGWILLIRPTNLVFICVAPFILPGEGISLRSRWGSLISFPSFLTIVTCAILVWTPQLFYWNEAFGEWFIWSYAGEGFSNWSSPSLGHFWFSTNNGAFTYAPVLFLILWGLTLQWRSGQRLAAGVSISTFLLISYFGASWWVWHFGCGFGSRTLVEYSAMFCLPMMTWLRWSEARWGTVLTWSLLGLFALVELKLVYSFGDCWFAGDWNWSAFLEMLLGPTK